MIKTYLQTLVYCCVISSVPSLAYETQFSLGWHTYSAKQLTGDPAIDSQDETGSSALIGVNIHNRYGNNEKHHFGTGIDISKALGKTLAGFRAIDYRYHINQTVSFGCFIGAASLNSGLPQNGYFAGLSGHWQLSNSPIGLAFEFRRADGLARDRLLQDDPEGEKPDVFVDIDSFALKLNWNFQ